jgi:hypothetical protein
MRTAALATLFSFACSFDAGGIGGGDSSSTAAGSSTTGAAPVGDDTTSTADTSSSGQHGGDAEGSDDDGSTSTTTAPGDPCELDNGGCDVDAQCTTAEELVVCTCPEGYEGDGHVCALPGALAGPLRAELDCGAASGFHLCFAGDDDHVVKLIGSPGDLYRVTLQVRGVVEQKSYDGGTPDGAWNPGGEPADDAWAVMSLEIAQPEQHIRLNNGASPNLELTAIDMTHEVVVAAGSDVRLALEGIDGIIVNNADNVVQDGVPPAPDPFDGQFVQIDVLAIEPL